MIRYAIIGFGSKTCYSFAHVDPDYAGYRTNDTPAETAERIVESIRRGMADALGELVLSPDELVQRILSF